jgi:RimJ/RimL family protein N-acetyltransferase
VTYRVTLMSGAEFEDMATWRYAPPYDFYDSDVEPVLNPERFFAVRDDSGAFVAHYYFEQKGDALEYGIGLRPELTGQGLGLDLFHTGLDFARARYSPTTIILAVAAFNARAISVYERAGFTETGRHIRTFERFGDVEFVDMVLAE